MFRNLLKIITFLGLVAAGTGGLFYYESTRSSAVQIEKLEKQKAQLEADKRQLQVVVGRLTAERRVAEVMVTDQRWVHRQQTDPPRMASVLQTSLLFVEYARDGSQLPPKHFTIEGQNGHFDAMVVKFERGFVADDDALRGRSIALFTRVYGDATAPERGDVIDEPGQIPDVYRGPADQVKAQATFERELWGNFWKLADDKNYRAQHGVRVAQGEGVWREFKPGFVYTMTLESDGGLNVSPEPIKAIYRAALKEKSTDVKVEEDVPTPAK